MSKASTYAGHCRLAKQRPAAFKVRSQAGPRSIVECKEVASVDDDGSLLLVSIRVSPQDIQGLANWIKATYDIVGEDVEDAVEANSML